MRDILEAPGVVLFFVIVAIAILLMIALGD